MSTQDMLVVADTHRGSLSDTTFELLGGARPLATATGGKVVAVIVGAAASQLGEQLLAADEVIVVDDPRAGDYSPEPTLAALESLVREISPRLVLFGSTSAGLDLAPTLAARGGWDVLNGCENVTANGQELSATVSYCGGKMLADVQIGSSPTVLLIQTGSFPAGPETGQGTVHSRPCPQLDSAHIQYDATLPPEAGDVDITQEELLIGVGRGIQQADNLGVAEELAAVLGGQLCASRPIIDQGWLPVTRQVGKSGMIVKPKCYFALGIRGAPEHVEGMADAELIFAVNSDPDAPIFETAHFGVAGDLLEIVPAITQALQNEGGD